MHDIVYVYVRDSSSSNAGLLFCIIDKLYPVTQRQRALLHFLFSHFSFARGWKPSQVVGESACYEWPSYVTEYHEYKSLWSAGKMLRLTIELTNPQDPFAVALINDGCVVEHVPKQSAELSPFSSGRTGMSASVK